MPLGEPLSAAAEEGPDCRGMMAPWIGSGGGVFTWLASGTVVVRDLRHLRSIWHLEACQERQLDL